MADPTCAHCGADVMKSNWPDCCKGSTPAAEDELLDDLGHVHDDDMDKVAAFAETLRKHQMTSKPREDGALHCVCGEWSTDAKSNRTQLHQRHVGMALVQEEAVFYSVARLVCHAAGMPWRGDGDSTLMELADIGDAIRARIDAGE